MGLQFLQVSNIAANGTVDLMVNADTGQAVGRTLTRPSQITVAVWADAVGIEMRIYSGLREQVSRSTLSDQGTVNQYPPVNEFGFSFFGAAGEDIRIELTEVAGTATTDVMGAVDITPVA